MRMKLSWILIYVLSIALLLTGCGVEIQTPSNQSGKVSESRTVPESLMQIQIVSDTASVLFQLNDSTAAKSLYNQLPLSIEVEDYVGSKKIFYPPDVLDVSNAPMAEGSAGTLAYYEPWGDVAIFYGECSGVNGLYALGKAISGADQIKNLTGEVRIEKMEMLDQRDVNSQEEILEKESQSGETLQPMQSLDESSQTQVREPSSNQASSGQNLENTTDGKENTAMKMNVQVGNNSFTATLENNAAVDALVKMIEQGPVTIQMTDFSGFEKVGPLGTSLPTSNSQTTTHAGDIVLYQGNQIVIFYGSNSWSYTRIGKIDDLTGWEEALGSGEVTVTFSFGK